MRPLEKLRQISYWTMGALESGQERNDLDDELILSSIGENLMRLQNTKVTRIWWISL